MCVLKQLARSLCPLSLSLSLSNALRYLSSCSGVIRPLSTFNNVLTEVYFIYGLTVGMITCHSSCQLKQTRFPAALPLPLSLSHSPCLFQLRLSIALRIAKQLRIANCELHCVCYAIEANKSLQCRLLHQSVTESRNRVRIVIEIGLKTDAFCLS